MGDNDTHFDLAAAATVMDRVQLDLLPKKDDPGSVGAQARVMLAVSKTLMLALMTEHNRGSALEDIQEALAALCANTINGIAPGNPDAALCVINMIVDDLNILNGVGDGGSARGGGVDIRPLKGGHA